MFASDYFAARDAFRRLTAGCTSPLPLSVRGPRSEPLSIDAAWLGDPAARRVLLVTSGLHGIEGFVGSAVQCAFLDRAPAIPMGCAVILIHALNPWGFAHLRRVNENNVDLNRNFLGSADAYSGTPGLYRRLSPFLNPPSPPRPDGCYLRAGWHAARHGVGPCRQAIAEGQYDFERGLFFGGRQLEQGPALVLAWIGRACTEVHSVLLLDLHSGLGPFAAQTVLADARVEARRTAELASRLQTPVRGGAGIEVAGGFATRGSFGSKLSELLPQARVESLTVEFGTYSGVRILCALREENRCHHYGPTSLDHPAKRRLLHAFSPQSRPWRGTVLASGVALLRRAVAAIAAD